MVDFVELQYATSIAGRQQRYQVKNRNPLRINFRCPLCNDSQKSKTKARGWIVEMPKSGNLHYNCFNCGASESLGNFIKIVDPSLYKEFITEKYVNKAKESASAKPDATQNDESFKTDTPKFVKNPLSKIKKVSQLKHDHPVKVYIDKRRIPTNQHYRLYYAPKFMSWINEIIPGKFANVSKDEPRLVMPLIDKDGVVFGVSARGFNPTGLRYITIMFQDRPKIFGLDVVDFRKTYFVVEGAIDSVFLSNSVAMVGADTAMDGLENLENAIFVHDAEPRNLQICDRMDKLLRAGRKVCVWPANVPGKDINEMHLAGMQNIESVIRANSYSGLEGQLRFRNWRKCA
jgi:transcription elongation factor Elf1